MRRFAEVLPDDDAVVFGRVGDGNLHPNIVDVEPNELIAGRRSRTAKLGLCSCPHP